jgi:hypothetical protein
LTICLSTHPPLTIQLSGPILQETSNLVLRRANLALHSVDASLKNVIHPRRAQPWSMMLKQQERTISTFFFSLPKPLQSTSDLFGRFFNFVLILCYLVFFASPELQGLAIFNRISFAKFGLPLDYSATTRSCRSSIATTSS